jgi:hypothetical protein
MLTCPRGLNVCISRDMRDKDSYRAARKRSRRKFWKLILFTIFLL